MEPELKFCTKNPGMRYFLPFAAFVMISCGPSDAEIVRTEKLKEKGRLEAQWEKLEQMGAKVKSDAALEKEMIAFVEARAKPFKDEMAATIEKMKALPNTEENLRWFEEYGKDHARRSQQALDAAKSDWDKLHPEYPMPRIDLSAK